MPSHFQTCLLVTALAGFANAKFYYSLEDNQFHLKEMPLAESAHENIMEHYSPEVLDHHHDNEDHRYLDEERLLREHKHF